MFDGDRLLETQTPKSLNMETGDEIDVVVEQVGGSQWYWFFYDFTELSCKWKSLIQIKEKQKKKRKSISIPFYINWKISYNPF